MELTPSVTAKDNVRLYSGTKNKSWDEKDLRDIKIQAHVLSF